MSTWRANKGPGEIIPYADPPDTEERMHQARRIITLAAAEGCAAFPLYGIGEDDDVDPDHCPCCAARDYLGLV